MPVVTPATTSLNVAVMLFARTTPVAFTAGVRAVTVGLGPVRNDQVVVASGAPARSRIAVAPPVRVTVYRVSGNRLAFGLRIHWFVVPFRDTTAPTSVGALNARNVNVAPLTPLTASLKVAVMLLPAATLVALTAGARAVTVGGGLARGGGERPAGRSEGSRLRRR